MWGVLPELFCTKILASCSQPVPGVLQGGLGAGTGHFATLVSLPKLTPPKRGGMLGYGHPGAPGCRMGDPNPPWGWVRAGGVQVPRSWSVAVYEQCWSWRTDGVGLSRLRLRFEAVPVSLCVPAVPTTTHGDMPCVQNHPEEATAPWPLDPAPSTRCCCTPAVYRCPPYPEIPNMPRAAPRRQHPQHPQSAFPRSHQPLPSADPLHKQRRGRGRVAGMLIYSPPLFSSLHPSGKGLCRYKQTLIKSCLTGNGSSKQQARKLSKSKGSCFCCCRCCLHSQMSLIL